MSTVIDYTDKSGTVTSGGTAQNAMGANTKRRGWMIYNASDITLYVNDMITAAADTGIALAPGQMIATKPGAQVSGAAISLLGATTGKKFLAREW